MILAGSSVVGSSFRFLNPLLCLIYIEVVDPVCGVVTAPGL